jgi:hypothetical protein
VVEEAVQAMPAQWVADDYDELAKLLERLWKRRNRVADLIEMTARSEARPFPNWSSR